MVEVWFLVKRWFRQ